jgi:Holliday junction resolvase RusA-like endonuclease
MSAISFFVPGSPEPQPRQKQRIVRTKSGQTFVSNYDPGTAEIWKREVRLVAIDHIPETGALLGPLDLELTFFFLRPLSHYGTGKNAGKVKPKAPKRLEHRPDSDNLAKAVMDCLTTVGMYRDDGQCDLVVRRRYVEPGQTGCQIVIVQSEIDVAPESAMPPQRVPAASGTEQPLLIQT